MKLFNALRVIPATIGDCHWRTTRVLHQALDLGFEELWEGADGAIVVAWQFADICRLVALLPEAVETQVLKVDVGREALAGVDYGPVACASAQVARHGLLSL